MSTSGPSPAPPSAAGTFTRKSSGLVRQVGTGDTFFYGMMQVAVAYVVFTIAFWVLYPGASMELATIIVLVGAIGLGLVYALFSSVYPRSGGEYVFLSRTTRPAIGFVSSFIMMFWQSYYFGVNGAFLALYGLGPLFSMLGIQLESQSLTDVGTFFGKDYGIFLTGASVVLFFAVIQTRGLGLYFKIQKWASFVMLGSLGITLLVLLLTATGVIDFQSQFDNVAGSGSYHKVITDATAEGINLHPGFKLGPTLQFMIWPAFSLFFAVLSVSFSGEIKNVKRGQLIGITSAMVVSALLLVAIMFLGRTAVSTDWLIAANSVGEKFPLGVEPFINVLTMIAGGNWLLSIVMDLWIILIIMFVAGTTLVYSSRAMLAWGLDGMAPKSLSAVSEKHHTPGAAIAATSVIALGCLAVFSFTDQFRILSGLGGMGAVFFVMCVVGALFPYVKRNTFEASPAAIRVGGIPLITIAGTIGAIFLGYLVTRSFVDDAFGANSTTTIYTNIGVLVVGILWYLVARAVRAKEGVDMGKRFAEIPVE
jgi:amino acid transporter